MCLDTDLYGKDSAKERHVKEKRKIFLFCCVSKCAISYISCCMFAFFPNCPCAPIKINNKEKFATLLFLTEGWCAITEFNKLLQYCSVPRTMPEILGFMGYSDRTKFRNKYLKPLLDEGKIEMTDPEHLRSSIQKYKTV